MEQINFDDIIQDFKFKIRDFGKVLIHPDTDSTIKSGGKKNDIVVTSVEQDGACILTFNNKKNKLRAVKLETVSDISSGEEIRGEATIVGTGYALCLLRILVEQHDKYQRESKKKDGDICKLKNEIYDLRMQVEKLSK